MKRPRARAELSARILLTAGALLLYPRLLTLRTLYVTDDYFASDIFNGELPGRVLIADALKRGELPTWTDQICSGAPLHAGGLGEAISLATFSLLPTAAALDVFVLVLLMVAAHGSYSLARRMGAARTAAVLAGLAFCGSGYIACQLKHLGIVSTVVWLPTGLTLLDGALSRAPDVQVSREEVADGGDGPSAAVRALRLILFGLVFGEQVLAGFPQSMYICGLVYVAFAIFRALTLRGKSCRLPRWTLWLGATAIVAALGTMVGAIALLPLAEMASYSPRNESPGFQWAVAMPYWPRNVFTFLLPYVNGDISDNTYTGDSFFWEDYGYVGAATFVLALYGVGREWRRPHVVFWGAVSLIAYLIVLGPHTPVFHVLWSALPGMKMFRFPTRFLILVELGLALLAAIGLTRLGADMRRWLRDAAPRAPGWLMVAACAGTALDLFIHQPRQNPMVDAQEWLSPPQMVRMLRDEPGEIRTLSLFHHERHRQAFRRARGWADLGPYYWLRDSLQPNIGVYWGIASADCYAGLAPAWVVNTWGDHNGPGLLLGRMLRTQPSAPPPPMAVVLGALGVTHVISPAALRLDGLNEAGSAGEMRLYRVEGARRVRVVPAARSVASDIEAADLMLSGSFSPDREVLVHEPLQGQEVSYPASNAFREHPGQAAIVHQGAASVEIHADVPAGGGYLFLAETYYPGWKAWVDGKPSTVLRANLMGRAVRLPEGSHKILFQYRPDTFYRALWLTGISILSLVIAAMFLGIRVMSASRKARLSPNPA